MLCTSRTVKLYVGTRGTPGVPYREAHLLYRVGTATVWYMVETMLWKVWSECCGALWFFLKCILLDIVTLQLWCAEYVFDTLRQVQSGVVQGWEFPATN
jgi:hypothetical protein